MSILQKQATIVAEFEALPQWEDRYKRIIKLGQALPALDEAHKRDENKVRGCSSTVWLVAEKREDGRVLYHADSDAILVRGLVSLLLEVYSGHRPEEILSAPPEFIEELGLNQKLTANRANGLAAMVKQIKTYALAFSSQS
jgi:cysteine desulfuration protein SufE